jgi:hypothetical protein
MIDEKMKADLKNVLEHCMKKDHPDFELAFLEYRVGLLTGYFVNPQDKTYARVWEVRYDFHGRKIYEDTWRETALFPIDGFNIPYGALPVKEYHELIEIGFYRPQILPDKKETAISRKNISDLREARFRLTEAVCEKHGMTVRMEIEKDNILEKRFYAGMSKAYRKVLDLILETHLNAE